MKTVIENLKELILPPMPKKEERKLIKRAQKGDKEARLILVRVVIAYAIKMGCKWIGKGMSEEDYTMIAIIGILKAIDNFDLRRKTNFLTYVAWKIKGEISHARTKGELIKIPFHRRYEFSPKKMEPFNIFNHDTPCRELFTPEPDEFDFMQTLEKEEKSLLHDRFVLRKTLKRIGEENGGVCKERIRQKVNLLIEKIRRKHGHSYVP